MDPDIPLVILLVVNPALLLIVSVLMCLACPIPAHKRQRFSSQVGALARCCRYLDWAPLRLKLKCPVVKIRISVLSIFVNSLVLILLRFIFILESQREWGFQD